MSFHKQLFHRFLASTSWVEARDLVARQGALLSPEIDDAFAELLSRLEPGPEYQDVLDHQQLLGLCRSFGVDAPFQDLMAPIDLDGLMAILGRLPQSGPSAARRILFSRRFLEVLPRDLAPPLWALAVDDQAKNLMTTPFGNRAANLEQAIYWLNDALSIRTREAMPAEWAETTGNLGTAYLERIRGNRAVNLERAIELYEQALALPAHRSTPRSWVITQSSLAQAYRRRIRGDRSENLERSIAAHNAALTVATRDAMPIDWAHATSDLALTYIERIAGNREKNLQEAIELCEAALRVRTRDDMPHEWAETMGYLGSAWSLKQGDRRGNLEKARAIYEAAIEATSRDERPEIWARLKHSLGGVYSQRLAGDPAENVEQAIRELEEALKVRTRDTPHPWAQTTNDLGSAYLQRSRGVREQNVERAWELLEGAFAVLADTAESREGARAANNLANACLERTRGNRSENLERAIELYQRALQHRDPQEWPAVTYNLALAYSQRVQGSRPDNLGHARDLYEKALDQYEGQPTEIARTCDALAQLYRDQSFPGDRTENLERSLAWSEKAIGAHPSQVSSSEPVAFRFTRASTLLFRTRGHRQDNLRAAADDYRTILETSSGASERIRAMAMTQLGRTYVRWQEEDREERIEEAIKILNDALVDFQDALTPLELARTRSLLGDAYNWRIRGDRAENLEIAIVAYEQALRERRRDRDPAGWVETINALAGAYRDRRLGDPAENLMKAATLYHDAIAQCPIDLMPYAHRELQGNLGRLQFYLENWEGTARALAAARRAGELLYEQSATTEGRRAELRQSVEYPSRAAYSLARLGRLDEAVEALEAGRTRFLAEALGLGEASLEGMPDEDRTRFVAARARVDELEVQARALPDEDDHEAYTRLSEQLGAARKQLMEVIDALRRQHPNFLEKPMDFPAIVDQVRRTQRPLCYLVATPHGSLALIVWPETSGDEAAAEAVWLDDFSSFDLRRLLRGEGDQKGYLDALGAEPVDVEHVTKIWPRLTETMTPVLDRLGQMGYTDVVLILCGALGMVPLHALRLEHVLFTLAPSARALRSFLDRARSRAQLPATLLAVGNPSSNLPEAELEVDEASAAFAPECRQVLIGRRATRQAVISAAPATYLHFTCHGEYDSRQPLDSALVLAGEERVRLRDLLGGDLDLSRSRLAILSACETAVFDTDDVPDEMIGLPMGMALAGVPGVVGTLWPVAALSCAFLIIRFLRHLLEENQPPPRALRQAQLWLRTATVSDLLAFVQRRAADGLSSPELLSRTETRFLLEDPDVRPFEAPYHWAGFVYVGA